MSDCIRRQHAYWTTCRCETCAPDRAMKRKKHYVGYGWRIPQEVAWEQIARRFTEGWSSSAVSSACGFEADYFGRHLAAWRRGEVTQLGPTVAAAIMAMGRPTAGQVGAEPSRRRLRALAAIAYSLKTIADESGVNFSTLAMVRSRNERVSAWVANAIADTYARISMIPGPDPQASRLARAKGWAPPLAWEDIDDPNEKPTGHRYKRRPVGNQNADDALDPVVVMRLLEGDRLPSTKAERTAALERWVADGGSAAELCRWHGWNAGRYSAGLRLVRGGAA